MHPDFWLILLKLAKTPLIVLAGAAPVIVAAALSDGLSRLPFLELAITELCLLPALVVEGIDESPGRDRFVPAVLRSLALSGAFGLVFLLHMWIRPVAGVRVVGIDALLFGWLSCLFSALTFGVPWLYERHVLRFPAEHRERLRALAERVDPALAGATVPPEPEELRSDVRRSAGWLGAAGLLAGFVFTPWVSPAIILAPWFISGARRTLESLIAALEDRIKLARIGD